MKCYEIMCKKLGGGGIIQTVEIFNLLLTITILWLSCGVGKGTSLGRSHKIGTRPSQYIIYNNGQVPKMRNPLQWLRYSVFVFGT